MISLKEFILSAKGTPCHAHSIYWVKNGRPCMLMQCCMAHGVDFSDLVNGIQDLEDSIGNQSDIGTSIAARIANFIKENVDATSQERRKFVKSFFINNPNLDPDNPTENLEANLEKYLPDSTIQSKIVE